MRKNLISLSIPVWLRIASLAGALLLAACGKTAAPEAAAAPPVPAPMLQNGELHFAANDPQLAQLTTQAATAATDTIIDLPARLVWNEERTQRVYPAFGGRVTAIAADVGQTVKAGAALARIASPDFGQAQADTAKAQVDVAFSRKALQRQRELFDAGIVARKDLEQTEADGARAQAEAMRASARSRLYGGGAGVDQQFALTAGIGGVVVDRNLNPGQEVRPDQSGPGNPPLFVVTDPTSLWVQIDAREADIASLAPGSHFQLDVAAWPGLHFDGVVLSVSDAIDPSTRTIKVRGRVANADRKLKAEMLATVHVHEALAGVVVPAAAVTLEGKRHLVFVETRPGSFAPREVVPGHLDAANAVLATGVAAGEQVVVDNAPSLAQMFADARAGGAPDAGGADAVAATSSAPAPASAHEPAPASTGATTGAPK